MTGWILSVVGMILAVTLAEIMLPEGETSKYVKGVISLAVVYVMIFPIPHLFSMKFDVDSFFDFSSASYEIDPAFIQIIKEDKQSALSEGLREAFRGSGLESAGAAVVLGEKNAVECVIISARKKEIDSAIEITLSYLNVKEDKVVINEIFT